MPEGDVERLVRDGVTQRRGRREGERPDSSEMLVTVGVPLPPCRVAKDSPVDMTMIAATVSL